MKRVMFATLMMLNLALGIARTAVAATPQVIPFQGRLTDAAGTPINAAQNLTFKIYIVATGGSAQFTETQNAVTVANGLFSVQIGSATGGGVPATVFSGADLFLGITVGSDPEMTPRQRLGSVPYAMRAGIVPALSLDRVTPSANVPSGSMGDMVTTTVTIPTSGNILVIGSGQFGFSAATGASNFAWFQIDETAGGGLDNEHYNAAGFTSSPGGTAVLPVSIMRAYGKSAGTYTFRLEAMMGSSTTGSAYFWQPTITAMFFPDNIGPVVLAPTVAATGAAQPQPQPQPQGR